MKIGYPAFGLYKDERSMLSNDFIESGLIGVFDTDLNTISVYEKEDLDMRLMEWLIEEEIYTIITPDIQVMALNVFRELNIAVYKAAGTMLSLNVELLENSCLALHSSQELYEAGAGACSGSSCSSCSSSCN